MEHHLLSPQQIFAGRYRIERLLAEGGMGAVFVAEHMATEQRVAVKVLWPQVLASKSAIEKFQLEAKVAGRINSDHIVRIIDAGFDDVSRMPFLVMELLEGRTLEAVVEQDGPLPPAIAYEYLRQVASGLDRAHSYVDKDGAPAPIVHRDLKPANLFLARRESGEPLVKILDFGIAKVVSEGTHVSQEVRGTPLFMAFEQANAGRITAQTDVWALGLIAFWALCGRNYWRSAQPGVESTLTQLFGEVLALPMDPPTARLAELGIHPPWGPAFDEWFRICVNRDPNLRFPSAGLAIAKLGEVLAISGRASSGLSAADSWAATAHVSPIGPSVAASTGTVLTRTRNTDEAPAKRSPMALTLAVGFALAIGLGVFGFAKFRSSSSPLAAEPSSQVAAALAQPTPSATVAPTAPPPEPAAAPASPASTAGAADAGSAQASSPSSPRAPAPAKAKATTPQNVSPPVAAPSPAKRAPDLYGER